MTAAEILLVAGIAAAYVFVLIAVARLVMFRGRRNRKNRAAPPPASRERRTSPPLKSPLARMGKSRFSLFLEREEILG